MEEQLTKIENELVLIKERNSRVQADKAWEVSVFRRTTIACTTYVIASIVLYAIGVHQFYLSAIIPTLGYVLSTLSLPFIKKWWVQRYFHKRK